MKAIRIHANIGAKQQPQTFISGAGTFVQALQALEAVLNEQSYCYEITKVERVELSD